MVERPLVLSLLRVVAAMVNVVLLLFFFNCAHRTLLPMLCLLASGRWIGSSHFLTIVSFVSKKIARHACVRPYLMARKVPVALPFLYLTPVRRKSARCLLCPWAPCLLHGPTREFLGESRI